MARPANKSTALRVVKRLRAAGFQALFAGGCVRDMLLDVRSTDYDLATNATPKQVRKLFQHVLLIGAKFGVAMVIDNGRKVEVTTFRSDLSYSDGRRPDGVRFTTPEEDARRRDFTINGMFYDPITKKILDTVGGRKDLARGVIRTIGKADRRFEEDYLRMIRAVRFAVRLGFEISPPTQAAIRRHAHRIVSISGERVFDELSKMLSLASAPQALALLDKLHLAAELLPELTAGGGLWQIAVSRAAALAKYKSFPLTLGGLLADLPSETIREITRRWGVSNELRDQFCFYSDHLDEWPAAGDLPLCDFKRLLASEFFPSLRIVWRFEEHRHTGRAVHARRIAKRIAEIQPDRIAPKPLLTGDDLIGMGISQGKKLGRVLRAVYDAQLNEEITTRQQAIALAEQLSENK